MTKAKILVETIIEPFAGYHGPGRPSLHAWQRGKTMLVFWDSGTAPYPQFKLACDCAAMNAELREIRRRYRPHCSRGASFSRGVRGFMEYVPIAAGMEAVDVIRRYFTAALMRLQSNEADADRR